MNSKPIPARYVRIAVLAFICGVAARVDGFEDGVPVAIPSVQAAVTSLVPAETAAQFGTPQKSPQVLSLDGSQWSVATDATNVGRQERWFEAAVKEAKPTKVPSVIQSVFPEYHGVAWYWHDFVAPANPHAAGRYLLRFEAVDYAAEVWVNGVPVGQHTGGESPFVLDATAAIKPEQSNRVAVRVLNPTREPIDGIALRETAHGCKYYPLKPGGVYNVGGIVDSVELIISPAVRIDDLFVRPDPKTGVIRVDATLWNASEASSPVLIQLEATAATGGPTLDVVLLQFQAVAGSTLVQGQLDVPNPRLWDLNDPHLYRVTARVWAEKSESFDDRSVRCGFRDFRFENGYFRLNGRRILPRGPVNLALYPVGFSVPLDETYLRREILAMKAMGMNVCRLIFGGTTARQLDMFDELGVMVYQASYAEGGMGYDGVDFDPDFPKMGEVFDQAVAQIVRRDRNHPSVVCWGLTNERKDDANFRHAVEKTLPMLRQLDDSRMVFLNSGRFDEDWNIGSLCNPGSLRWESSLRDQHFYPNVPHVAATIHALRTMGTKDAPVLLSEYGTGNAIDLPRYARHFEQLGAEASEDARFYRGNLDQFMADWKRWRLDEVWARPEDFFAESNRTMAALRWVGENALRANPNLAGRFFCAIADSDFDGVGILNAFRELKPGSTDVMTDVWAPLRWCLFVEPVQAYRRAEVQLEAVLANEDLLQPGEYPVRIQVVGPNNLRVFEKTISAKIPNPKDNPEPAMVLPVFSEAVTIDGPSGKYRFLATFERGAAAAGGEVEFYVTDPVDMPTVEKEVVLWGDDPELAKWATEHGIRIKAFTSAPPASREVILAGLKPPTNAGAEEFREIARRIAGGSSVVFLCSEVFAKGDQPTAWVPLKDKGWIGLIDSCGGYYRGDTFAKRHPIFDGLPSGGILDYTFYREIIPEGGLAWIGLSAPTEVVAGGIRANLGYGSGTMISVHQLGAGQFILNTLNVRKNLGHDPVAERLLRNMLNYAARDVDKPLAELPADFETQLKSIGY